MELMHNELKVLEQTVHPNIVRVFELMEDADNYYIVSELVKGGELYERIIQMKHFSEQNAAYVIYQLLLALAYMHSENIIHRDIKPENILLEHECDHPHNLNIKVTDFGFACFYKPGETNEVLGSPLYMAPEIVAEQAYNQKVDIWSTGVIAYILLSGRPPFPGKSKKEIFHATQFSKLSFDHPPFTHVSPSAKDFISRALCKDQEKRPDARQLLEHEWIKEMVKEPEVKAEKELGIGHNLREFMVSTNRYMGFIYDGVENECVSGGDTLVHSKSEDHIRVTGRT